MHNMKKTRAQMSKLFDPHFVEFSDYDYVVSIILPDVETFLKLRNDPLYIERMSKDHSNFADLKKKTRCVLSSKDGLILEE